MEDWKLFFDFYDHAYKSESGKDGSNTSRIEPSNTISYC